MLTQSLPIALGIAIATVAIWIWNSQTSFRSQKIADYQNNAPVFDIMRALDGPMVAEGLIYDFRGRVVSRFVAQMQIDWTGRQGVMSETFSYDTGRTQNRKWTITMGDGGEFTATAPDILGIAQGEQAGNAVRLRYRIRLPRDVGGHVLDVVDWMYLTQNDVIMNKSEFRKFGIKVGELIATFRKLS